MMTRPPAVFLSVSITRDERQNRAVASLKDYLAGLGVECVSVENKTQKPVQTILKKVGRCDGMIILAFERTEVTHGFEKRGTDNVSPVANESLTTVWHHIEGAMALTLNIPLLVLRESTLKPEGILFESAEWDVRSFSLDNDVSTGMFFDSYVRDFLEDNGLLKALMPGVQIVHEGPRRLTARSY